MDFAGTAPQCAGNLNCPLPVTAAAVWYAFRCLMPDGVPACAGAFESITLRAPARTLVNAERPAAVAAGNVETSQRIVDVVLGALAHQELPFGVVEAESEGQRPRRDVVEERVLERRYPFHGRDDEAGLGLIDGDDEGPAGPPQQKTVTLADLGLEPVDLIYMLDLESEKSLTALDDCILKFVHESEGLRPDAELKINYTRPVTGKVTFFELSPLIRSLRTLTLSARALQQTDMTLQNEAREEQNTGQFIRLDRITKTRQLLDDTRSLLETNFINPLSIHIDPEDFEITMGAKTQIINALDGLIAVFIDQLRALNEFGMPHTGFGFVYDRKKAICAAVYNKVTDYKKRWQQKSDAYNDLLSNQFPAAATDEEKLAILQKAERTISTESTVPVPTVADYLVILNGGGSEVGKKKLFDDKYDELENFLNTGFSSLKALIDGANALNTGINLFDPELIDFTEDRWSF